MNNWDAEFDALRQSVAEANLEDRARKIAHHLLTAARKRTPVCEQWRIAAEIDRIIRTYDGGER